MLGNLYIFADESIDHFTLSIIFFKQKKWYVAILLLNNMLKSKMQPRNNTIPCDQSLFWQNVLMANHIIVIISVFSCSGY